MVDASTAEFEQHRRFLTGLAYRMLGSLSDAQDIVQDAFLRWHGSDPSALTSPRAWLGKIVTRLCLDMMKSARSRHETYVGQWLPEPVIEPVGLSLSHSVDDRIDAPVALMLALERLSPLERAAFILHDIFEMEFDELANALDRSEAACRQLLVRARGHVGDTRQRYEVDAEEANRITAAFVAATSSGDASALRDLLADAARLQADGGGKCSAIPNMIQGADKIARFFAGLTLKAGAQKRLVWSGPLRINGMPGFVALDPFGTVQAIALEIENGRITAIYNMRNPDKLAGAEAFLPASSTA